MVRSQKEVLDTLASAHTSPTERVDAVLSAIFYGQSAQFSGDVIIEEFSKAKYKEKLHLKNLFETFYQMNQTAYRIDESIQLLTIYKNETPDKTLEIESTINALIEYKTIFGAA